MYLNQDKTSCFGESKKSGKKEQEEFCVHGCFKESETISYFKLRSDAISSIVVEQGSVLPTFYKQLF